MEADEGSASGRGAGAHPPPGRSVRVPTAPDRYRYSIGELSEQTGLPARTIRYYVTRGLLAPAYGRGPSATYDLGHLLRLRLIAKLQDERLRLDEIKDRLGRLSDDEISALLGVQTAPRQDTWRRIALHPDIELHVRERQPSGQPRDTAFDEAVELIVGLARPVIDRIE